MDQRVNVPATTERENCSPAVDALTGILNREAVLREMERFLGGVGEKESHALLLVDIDNLKAANEALGRTQSEEAVRKIASALGNHFRKDDIIGRTDDDEFAVFVKNVSPDVIARKTRSLLDGLQFVLFGDTCQVITTASAGIALIEDGKKNAEALYKEARKALKKAKEAGRNTFAFSENRAALKAAEQSSAEGGILSVDLKSLLNNLRIGIVIFHGDGPDELVPVFCNEGYLHLSNLSYEQFKRTLVKENEYNIHPDDLVAARKAFHEAYHGDLTFQQTVRMNIPEKGVRWFTLFGSIQLLPTGGFDVYTVFTDATRDMHERQLDAIRYDKSIEAIRRSATKSLSTVHLNLTSDNCHIIHRDISVAFEVDFDESVDAFINTAALNIAYAEERAEFIRTFNREALIRAFEEGTFSIEKRMPLRLEDGEIIWCLQKVDCSKNPITGELEGIMRLIDADVILRVSEHYERILLADYEYVADINTQTGLLSVISEVKDRGVASARKGLSYDKNMPTIIRVLVEDEFVEEAIHAMQFDTVRAVLEKQPIYTCAFPAKKSLLGRDGAFQWRFGYADKKRRDILFTRREMMGFLERGQKAEEHEKALPRPKTSRRMILIADDAEMNREMLRMIFEEDFEIIEAQDGEEAIHLIDTNYASLALILLDLQMPKKTGLDVLIHLKMRDLTETIPVMMVTGSISADMNLRSLEYGIADVVSKPFDSKVVKRRALNLIAQYAHKEDVERQLEQWKQEALELQLRTEKNNELLINTLSSVVEFRSLESGLHINRVRRLTEIMLKTWTAIHPEDHFDRNTIDQISRAATLHDIGKVAIPDNILLKPGRLTPEEFEEMKKHTIYGCEMLESFEEEDNDFYRYCYEICRYHHERSDGRGYPDGLMGDQIPVWAQIVSVVDVFDALISPRVYKDPVEPKKAVEMIQNGECGRFSDKLLACFEVAEEQIIAESIAMAKEERKRK